MRPQLSSLEFQQRKRRNGQRRELTVGEGGSGCFRWGLGAGCGSVRGGLIATMIFFQAAQGEISCGGHGFDGDVELDVISIAVEAAAMDDVPK